MKSFVRLSFVPPLFLPGFAQAAPQSGSSQQTAPAPNAPAPNSPAPESAPPATIAQQAQQAQQVQPVAAQTPFHVEMPHSRNPFAPYKPTPVPPVNLTNSPRLQNLERDGKLYISLRDAIALALENNLDIAYFRYNFPTAEADLLRTKAGGSVGGVNTSIVQGTQGGFSSSGVGGGAFKQRRHRGRRWRPRDFNPRQRRSRSFLRSFALHPGLR